MTGGGGQSAFHEGLVRLPPHSTQGPARDVSEWHDGTARSPGSMRYAERAGAREASLRRRFDHIPRDTPLRSFNAKERVPHLGELPGV